MNVYECWHPTYRYIVLSMAGFFFFFKSMAKMCNTPVRLMCHERTVVKSNGKIIGSTQQENFMKEKTFIFLLLLF